MKKILGLFVFMSVLLSGCNESKAQNNVSMSVGTPNSDDSVIVERAFEVISVPADSGNTNSSSEQNMENLPDSPNVEVAPAPQEPSISQNSSSDNNNPQPAGGTEENVTIDEIIQNMD